MCKEGLPSEFLISIRLKRIKYRIQHGEKENEGKCGISFHFRFVSFRFPRCPFNNNSNHEY